MKLSKTQQLVREAVREELGDNPDEFIKGEIKRMIRSMNVSGTKVATKQAPKAPVRRRRVVEAEPENENEEN